MTKNTHFKKRLLASASVLAVGAFSAGQAGAAPLASTGNTAGATLDSNITLGDNYYSADESPAIVGNSNSTLTTSTFEVSNTVGRVFETTHDDWTSLNLIVNGGDMVQPFYGGNCIYIGKAIANGTADAVSGTPSDLAYGITITAGGYVGSFNGIAINLEANGSIYNAGRVDGATTGSAIKVGASMTGAITNAGIISTSGSGVGINLLGALTGTATNTNGVIYNTGTISTVGGAGAVTINALITNSLYNSSTGAGAGLYNAKMIQDKSAGVALLLSGAGATNITNASAGTISTTGAGNAVRVTAAGTGTFLNAGSITTASGDAINIGTSGKLGAIINSGTINSTSGDAIDASLSTLAAALSLTNTGTITGNIKTSTGGTNVINLNGGSVTGGITESSARDQLNFYSAGTGTQTITGAVTYGALTATGGTTTITGAVNGYS